MASVYADARYKLLPSTVVVFVTWWIGLTLYDVIADPVYYARHLPSLLSNVLHTGVWWGFGLMTGGSVAFLYHWHRRGVLKARLAGTALRSYYSSLGPVPILKGAPPAAKTLPPLSTYDIPDDGANRLSLEVEQWLLMAAQSHPKHHALMLAILKVMVHYANAPATHIRGGHGGRSLIQHSLLTGKAAIATARTWEYKGKRNPQTGKIDLPLTNPHYVFDRNDPLIALVSVSHDIGKIEMYKWSKDGHGLVYDPSGNIEVVRKDHDTPGALMLARMPELWELPDEDRRILLQVVAHYHKPQFMPLDPQRRAVTDREHALLELLIKADSMAGKVEAGELAPNSLFNGMALLAAEAAEESLAPPAYTPDQLWQAFFALVSEPGLVSGKDVFSSRAIGQKSNGLVFLKENELRLALIAKLGISGTHRFGDGRYKLTQDLMEILEQKGALYQSHNGLAYSYKRALFRVRFINSRDGKVYGPWPTVVVIKPGPELPTLSALLDHPSNYEIERPVFGENSALNKAAKPGEDVSSVSSPDMPVSQAVDSGPQPAQQDVMDSGSNAGAVTTSGRAVGLDDLLAMASGEPDVEAISAEAGAGQEKEMPLEPSPDGVVPDGDEEGGVMAWQKPRSVEERAEDYNRKVGALPYKSAKKLGKAQISMAASEQARIASDIMDALEPEPDHDGLVEAGVRLAEMALSRQVGVVYTPNHGYLVALSEAKKAIPTFSWDLQIGMVGAHLTAFEVVHNKSGKPYLKFEALNRPENAQRFAKEESASS